MSYSLVNDPISSVQDFRINTFKENQNAENLSK